MTTPLPVGPLSPYVTPELLTQAPTGISWSTIPPGRDVTYEMRLAEQSNICQRATAMIDAYCNQVLRATVDVEQQPGPNYRMTIQTGVATTRIVMQRWPILQIINVEVAANAIFPRQWTSLQSGMWDIEVPVVGLYGTSAPSSAGEGGQAIILPPGTVTWNLGRNGYLVRTTYINGWPHTGLTANVTAGSQSISVDDCTGWGITGENTGFVGATGTIYDAGSQEVIQVTSTSTVSGPGTLTLAVPLTFNHDAGTMVTTLPASVTWAAILFCSSIALTRGATATTIQTIPGGGGSAGTGSKQPGDLAGEAELLLNPFRRTI